MGAWAERHDLTRTQIAGLLLLAAFGAFAGSLVVSGAVWALLLTPDLMGSGLTVDDLDRVRDSIADAIADVVGAGLGAILLPAAVLRYRSDRRAERHGVD